VSTGSRKVAWGKVGVADGRLHAVRGGWACREKEHGRNGANDGEEDSEALHLEPPVVDEL
jgi:hypothetical protein